MTIDAGLVIGAPGQRVRRQLDGLATAVTIRETRRHGEGVAARAIERLWREHGVRATSVLHRPLRDVPRPHGAHRAIGARAPVSGQLIWCLSS